MARALKGVYTACDADAAYAALADLAGTRLGKKCPAAVAVWERAWDRFVPAPCLLREPPMNGRPAGNGPVGCGHRHRELSSCHMRR